VFALPEIEPQNRHYLSELSEKNPKTLSLIKRGDMLINIMVFLVVSWGAIMGSLFYKRAPYWMMLFQSSAFSFDLHVIFNEFKIG
jgi:hypothetical protein